MENRPTMVVKPTAETPRLLNPSDTEPMEEMNPISVERGEVAVLRWPTNSDGESSSVRGSELSPQAGGSGGSEICVIEGVGGDESELATTDSVIPQIGWKTRKKAMSGPDSRSTPRSISAIDACLMKAKGNRGLDIFAPEVGTTFDSCQEAYDLYNLFSWEHGFGIRHSRSRVNANGYSLMHDLVCQCQGKSEKENAASCRTDCKAKIRLLRTDDHGWYVSMFDNEHNHPLSTKCGEKRQWNSHNDIDPLTKDLIKNLRDNNVSLGKVYNILCATHGENSGAPYRKQNLRYLCSRMAQDSMKEDISSTLKLLQEMRAVDSNLVVAVNVDKEGSVKSILWCSGKNQDDYAQFGDVVTFDTMYRTNLYNMPFGLFVGVNNHFQSTIFGGVLMCEETIAGFEWAFQTFVGIMNGKHPETILTDQCRAMEAAIKSMLPHTRHRWCKWHVLRCAKEKLGNVYSKHSGFKREFHSIINEVMCIKEFECRWSDLLQKYKLTSNPYMMNLYSKRTKWAKPYFAGVFCAGMSSTQRSESANHLLKQFIPRSSPMHLFVRQYNNLLRSRAADESREEHVTKMKRRVFKGGHPLEVDASQIYTRAVFNKFEEEMYQSCSFVVSSCTDDNTYGVVRAKPDITLEYESRTFHVSLKEGGELVTCDCGWIEHIGMLCRHAIKVLVRNDILKIPTKNIVKRWTKWARETYPEHLPLNAKRDHEDDFSYRRNIMNIAAQDLIKECATTKIMFDKVMKAFRSLKAESITMKNLEVTNVQEHQDEEPSLHDFITVTSCEELRPPKRVKSRGRPATVRPKSRMDYVSVFKQKSKKVESFYGDENLSPDGLGSIGGRGANGEINYMPTKTIKCSKCKSNGHNKATCKERGF